MKLILPLLLLTGNLLTAQAIDTTVCDIVKNPQSFDGKIVRVKGVVVAGFEEFAINGSGCGQAVNAIWLAYPEGTRGKAGPAAMVRLQLAKNHPATVTNLNRTPVTLEKNKDFKAFDNALATPAKVGGGGGICLGCVKFSVSATLVGRLDGTKDAGWIRDESGKIIGLGGFGHLNRYRARLVLQSVADVAPQEIDYASGGAAAASNGNRAFTPGAPAADQVRRGADAFGAPGEDNGVNVGFGGANEVPGDDSTKSSANASPDGLLFSVVFDGDRLKGAAMQMALSHLGTHIADLRSPSISLPAYGIEFRGWQTTLVAALGAKIKTVMMPGGYVLFSQGWSDAEMGKNANDGIAKFLENWVQVENLGK